LDTSPSSSSTLTTKPYGAQPADPGTPNRDTRPGEPDPVDPDLRLHLEALNQLDDDERTTVINLIESVLLRHHARRLSRAS
jgi:hypothetical protein